MVRLKGMLLGSFVDFPYEEEEVILMVRSSWSHFDRLSVVLMDDGGTAAALGIRGDRAGLAFALEESFYTRSTDGEALSELTLGALAALVGLYDALP